MGADWSRAIIVLKAGVLILAGCASGTSSIDEVVLEETTLNSTD